MLNLKHLYYFYIFSQELSITRAAKRLTISSPALSNQLKELEAFLGFKLTQRVDGKVLITDLGKMVSHYADKMFSTYEELKTRLPSAGDPKTTFRIGIGENLGPRFSFDLLALIVKSQLLLTQKSSVKFEATDRLLTGLKNDEYDLVIGSFVPQTSEDSIWSNQALTFPVRLFAPLNLSKGISARAEWLSRLDLNSAIELANTMQISLVIPMHPSVLRNETDQFLLHLKILPERVIECNNSSAIVELIERGYAMGFAPTPCLLDFRSGDNLNILGPPGGYWNHGISVTTRKGAEGSRTKISPLAEMFRPDSTDIL